MERLVMDGMGAKHVQAYIEYEQIVGNADGGVMMDPKQFEEFKKNISETRKNRLYVHWRNMDTGSDCKAIGPSSQCFCGHRFKEHYFDNIKTKQVYCRATGARCPCKLFDYVPIFGSQDLKCMCKHSCNDHNPNGNKECKKPNCKCAAFHSVHNCSCGQGFDRHQTIFATREERLAEGRPVDPKHVQDNNLAAGMGGLTNFSDLADHQEKADMMSMKQIMGNLEGAGHKAVGYGGQNKMQAIGQGNQPLAIQGGQIGSGLSQNNQQLTQHSGQVDALSLFMTPHQYSGGSSKGITKKMGQLKM